MHRGVQEFVGWLVGQRDAPEVALGPPAAARDVAEVERSLGMPLPADHRWVLSRFNGGRLPSATLFPASQGQGSIVDVAQWFAQRVGREIQDPDVPLPFGRADEGSVLAFDRSAGPLPDTWPVIDVYEQTGETRLVSRTFDGWCRFCVEEWRSPDFGSEQSLDSYLRQGERRVRIEPDVSVAHAQLAHALKRAGRPEESLAAYLRAAECVPPLPWCDWEALKVAALLRRPREALVAASRLAARGPRGRWEARETSPGRVAEVLATLAPRVTDARPWLAVLDELVREAADDDDRARVERVRQGFLEGSTPTRAAATGAGSAPPPVPPFENLDAWWKDLEGRYLEGSLREEELLTDPGLEPIRRGRDLGGLLRLRREL